MSEEKQVVTQDKPVPVPMGRLGVQLKSMEDLYRFSKAVAVSGFAPKGMEKPESIMIAIQAGLEIGLSPIQAVQSVAVINGRPGVFGDTAKALVEGSGLCEEFTEAFAGKAYDKDFTATCTIKRKGRAPVVQTFSVEDATRAKLWGKGGPWSDYPKRMLQMRARAFAIRDAFPDVLKGIGLQEEVADIIDVTPEADKPKPVKTLDDVVERYVVPVQGDTVGLPGAVHNPVILPDGHKAEDTEESAEAAEEDLF